MGTSPQLSVIIPTHNRATLLRMTVESVLEQTFSDYEIIVVDDGSTDRTEDAIAQLLKDRPAHAERIRYFFQRNQGKSVALNNGLSEARGEWIAFLDSDDLWLPNKIEEQFRTLQQYASQSEACFTNARYINNPACKETAFEHAGKWYKNKTGLLTNLAEFIGNPYGVYMQTILVHSRTMAKVGDFDPTLWTGQDVDFVFRLSVHTSLCYVNTPLVLIDRAPRQQERLTELKSRRVHDVFQLRQGMYEKWLSLSDGLGIDAQKAVRGHLRGLHSERANWYLMKRQYREARRAISEAARVQPTPGTAAKWCLTVVAPALARNIVLQRSRLKQEQRASLASDSAGKESVNLHQRIS